MSKTNRASVKLPADTTASTPAGASSGTKQVEADSLRRRLPAILLDSWELRKFVPEGSVLPNALISWDVDGDGIEEVVVGTTEGHLLVLKPECRAPIFTYLIGATISIVLYSERQQRLVLCTMEGHCEVFEPFLSRQHQQQQQQQQQQEGRRSVPSSPSTPLSTTLAEETVSAKTMPRNSSTSHLAPTAAAVTQWRSMHSKGADANPKMKMGMPSSSSHTSLHEGVSAHDTELPSAFTATAADHVFHIASNCLCGALGTDYNNNHNLLFLGSYDRRLYVYHVLSGACLMSLFCHHPIMAVRSFSIPVPKGNKTRHPTPTSAAAAATARGGGGGGGGASDKKRKEDEDDSGTEDNQVTDSIPLVAVATSHTLALLPAALTSIQSWDLQEKQTQRPLALADPIAFGGYDAFNEYTAAAASKFFSSFDDTERQATYGVSSSADGGNGGAVSRLTSTNNINANSSPAVSHASMTSLPPPTLVHPLWFLEIGLNTIRVMPPVSMPPAETDRTTIAPSARHENEPRGGEPELTTTATTASSPKGGPVIAMVPANRIGGAGRLDICASDESGEQSGCGVAGKEVVHLAIDIDVSVSATRAVLVAACEDGRAFVLNLSVDEAPLTAVSYEHSGSPSGDSRAMEVVHGRTPCVPSMVDGQRDRSPDADNSGDNSSATSVSGLPKLPHAYVLHDFTKHQAHGLQRQRRKREKVPIPSGLSTTTTTTGKGFSVRHTTTNTKQGVPDYNERSHDDPLLTIEVPYPPSAKALRAQVLDAQQQPLRATPLMNRRRQGSPALPSRRGTEILTTTTTTMTTTATTTAPREPLALLLRAECAWASGLDRNPLVQRARVFRVRADEFCAVFVSVSGDCYAVDPDLRTVVRSSIKADCTSFTIIAGGSSIMSGWRREPFKDEIGDGKPPTGLEDGGSKSGNRNLLSGAVGRTVSCVCIGVDELCIYSVGEAYLTITHKQLADAQQQGNRSGTTPGGSFHCQPSPSRSLASSSPMAMGVSPAALLASTTNNSFADLTYSLCCTPGQLTGPPALDGLTAPFAYTPLGSTEQREEEELLLELGQRLVELEGEEGHGAVWDPEQYVSYARQVLTKGFTEEEWRTLQELDTCET